MIEESFQTYLISDSGINAIVGDRVYGLIAPQKVLPPFLVYLKVGDYPIAAGYCGPDAARHCVFQFDSYAKSYLGALRLAEAVRTALVGFTGTIGDTRIAFVSMETEFHAPDPEPGLFRVSNTFEIWYG
jgi:Protein of unknown function (DUF3168)